jgi:hypothetical protein
MAAVQSVFVWRPHHGRLLDFMEFVDASKVVHENLGGQVRTFQPAFGHEPMSIHYVIEHKDWADLGAFGERLDNSEEWRDLFMRGVRDNKGPSGALVGSHILVETPSGGGACFTRVSPGEEVERGLRQ